MAEIRASDREREQVAARLRDALAEGRLEPDEFEDRLQLAYAARSRSRLAVLVEDLPALTPARPVRSTSRSIVVSRRAVHLVTYVLVSVLLVCLWMVDVGARDPWIVGESDSPLPLLLIVAGGIWLAGRAGATAGTSSRPPSSARLAERRPDRVEGG